MARTKQTARATLGAQTSGGTQQNAAYVPLEPPAPMTAKQRARIDNEDHYRKLFAEQQYSSDIDDPHVLLTNVFDNTDKFVYQDEDADEAAVPKLLASYRKKGTVGEPSVVSRAQFTKNWQEFTGGILDGLDWSHVFAAGGSVLACLTPNGLETAKSSDIDLFLYDIADDSQANDKLRSIYETVQKNCKNDACPILRTFRAVTILCEFPMRHVQVILKLFKSPAEVLLGFDIDCCCAGFDGTDTWAMERFMEAHNKSYNLVNTTRRSLTYEPRLFKYGKRGYAIAVPDLDKSHVDPAIFNQPQDKAAGLTKLLLYERDALHPGVISQVSYTSSLRKMLGSGRHWRMVSNDSSFQGRLEEYAAKEAMNPSDYSEVFIPWGPNWKTRQILQILQLRDRAQFFSKVRGQKGANPSPIKLEHKHCFVTGIEGVFAGQANSFWCRLCKAKKPLEGDEQGRFVTGPLRWVKDHNVYQDFDHGFRRALHGSWHPILETNYDQGVYMSGGQAAPLPSPLQHTEGGAPAAPPALSSFARAPESIIMCPSCSMTFTSNNELSWHQREKHRANPFATELQPGSSLFGSTKQATAPRPSFNVTSVPTSHSVWPEQATATSTGPFGTTSTKVPNPFSFPAAAAPAQLFGSAAPAHLFGSAAPAQLFGSAAPALLFRPAIPSPFGFGLQQASNVVAPELRAALGKLTDKVSRLLFLVAHLAKLNMLTAEEKGKLKDLLLNNRASMMCMALEVFEVDQDLDDFTDTLKVIARKQA
eukprot:TRINITY_DN226_c0_g1_i1.p1 TRINITY_DN226_c0_g1~~TRINITY_DN226_c0_g1_i1.p1  ORF type:complete len:785 (-),score=192.29 TRINITY_DN226_c0_g1_i1:110-2389(-)